MKKFGLRRRNKRLDTQRKLVKRIVEFAEEYNLTILVEDLGKNFNQRITSKSNNKSLKNKLHNISANGFLKLLEEKALEFGIPLIRVNPAFTSQMCPICGSLNKPDDDALCHRRVRFYGR